MSTELLSPTTADLSSFEQYLDRLATICLQYNQISSAFQTGVGTWLNVGYKSFVANDDSMDAFCKDVSMHLVNRGISISWHTLRGWASVCATPELAEVAERYGTGLVASAKRKGESPEETIVAVHKAIVDGADLGISPQSAARLANRIPGARENGIPRLRTERSTIEWDGVVFPAIFVWAWDNRGTGAVPSAIIMDPEGGSGPTRAGAELILSSIKTEQTT